MQRGAIYIIITHDESPCETLSLTSIRSSECYFTARPNSATSFMRFCVVGVVVVFEIPPY